MKFKSKKQIENGCGEYELGESPCQKDSLCKNCSLLSEQIEEIVEIIEKCKIKTFDNINGLSFPSNLISKKELLSKLKGVKE